VLKWIEATAMIIKNQTVEDLILTTRAGTLRQAGKIAETQQSPLAAELWNLACRRIQEVLLAEAGKLDPSAPLRPRSRVCTVG
jgi:hypothetical protein